MTVGSMQARLRVLIIRKAYHKEFQKKGVGLVLKLM